MRKTILKPLLAIVCLLSSITLYAHDFEADGIYYNITSETDKTVEVTSSENFYVGSVVIPETVSYQNATYSVTSIGEWAFSRCTGLTEVTIPNSVTSIGNFAFESCKVLRTLYIGNGVTEIRDYAFNECDRIKDIYAYPVTPPVIGPYTFTIYANDNATLHVVKGCKEDYSDANYWENFLNITDDLTAGIEDIMVDTDNTPAEYYDLNGCRVDHPTHGIYIMKQGNTVRKVVL